MQIVNKKGGFTSLPRTKNAEDFNPPYTLVILSPSLPVILNEVNPSFIVLLGALRFTQPTIHINYVNN